MGMSGTFSEVDLICPSCSGFNGAASYPERSGHLPVAERS